MRVILLDESFELINENSSIDILFNRINDIIKEKDYVFSHFIVDGVDVYNDFEIYLSDQMESIQTIEVVVKSVEEFINDLLLSAEEYLTNAVPEMKVLADEIYQKPDQTNEKFQQFLTALQWLNQMIETIGQSKYTPQNWNSYMEITNGLEEELSNMEEAVFSNDFISVADIINYEIVPLMEMLSESVTTTIDSEGKRENVN